VMTDARAKEILAGGFCGRLATVGADGFPYCVPLLYVTMDDEIFVHNTAARGHLRSNVEHAGKVCFEIDQPGEVFDYGRFECDSSVAYRSVIVFGEIRIVEDRALKARFCDGLMAKYGKKDNDRPKGFYPRLDQITVTHAGRSQAQARLLAAWILSRTDRHPIVELISEARRDMRSGSLVGVVLTCRKERFEVMRVAEGVAELRTPYLDAQQARLWVPHLPMLVAEELGIYERDESFEAAVAQLAT